MRVIQTLAMALPFKTQNVRLFLTSNTIYVCWVKLIFKVKYVGEMVSKTYVDVFLIEILILKVMIATGFTCLVAHFTLLSLRFVNVKKVGFNIFRNKYGN